MRTVSGIPSYSTQERQITTILGHCTSDSIPSTKPVMLATHARWKALTIAVAVGLQLGLGSGLPASLGDVFVLDSGGQLIGELQNPDESPRQRYVVQTPEGAVVTLARSQVKQWLRPKSEEIEYETIRSRFPDTPEGQWDLAEWCKQRKLYAQRKAHLQRVLQLDPNHEQAHRALDHILVNGQWTTQRELMSKQGYRWYQGRWRTQQEIDILEDKRGQNTIEKEWTQKIERWVSWLGTDRAEEARNALGSIQDPAAVKGLVVGLTSSRHPQARMVLAEALARLNTPAGWRALAASAIDDPVEEVRLTCLDFLKKQPNPEIVAYFVSRLDDKVNLKVNRAGAALKVLGDRSAIGPLIDHLVTAHKFKVPGSNPGQTTSTFGRGPGGSGGGGLAVGGGPKVVVQHIANPDVLDALVALTGQVRFGYDVVAWRTWYAAEKKQQQPAPTDIRRNP